MTTLAQAQGLFTSAQEQASALDAARQQQLLNVVRSSGGTPLGNALSQLVGAFGMLAQDSEADKLAAYQEASKQTQPRVLGTEQDTSELTSLIQARKSQADRGWVPIGPGGKTFDELITAEVDALSGQAPPAAPVDTTQLFSALAPSTQRAATLASVRQGLDLSDYKSVQKAGLDLLKRGYAPEGEKLLDIAKTLYTEVKDPKIVQDVEGYQRYATGPKAGERVFPEATKPEKQPTGEQYQLVRLDQNGSEKQIMTKFVPKGTDMPTAKPGFEWRPMNKGVTVEAPKPDLFRRRQALRDDYKTDVKGVNSLGDSVSRLETLLALPRNAANDQAITTALTEVFSSNVRAVAELDKWRNLGNLGQRIAGNINRFTSGTRVESQYQQAAELAKEMRSVIQEGKRKIDQNHWDRAEYEGVDPEQTHNFGRIIVKKHSNGKKYKLDTWTKEVIGEVK